MTIASVGPLGTVGAVEGIMVVTPTLLKVFSVDFTIRKCEWHARAEPEGPRVETCVELILPSELGKISL